jgi:transcription initiation factor TFIIB
MAITPTTNRNGAQTESAANVSCAECGSTEVVRDIEKGEIICTTCGLVLSDHRIDTGPDWRAFTSEEKDSRAHIGAPASYRMHDKGLSTMIDWRDHDVTGKRFTAKQRAQIHRLRKWQIRTRIHSSMDRNLTQAMTELDRLASQLELARSIRELAALLYRKLIVGKRIRSRSIDATVAASIYAACRLRKTPRTLEEIANLSRISKKKVGAHYRTLVTKLNIRMPIPKPQDYVPRIISELDLPNIVQAKVLEILDDAEAKTGLISGRDPRGLAAAAIYIASIVTDNRVTQHEIASAAGVTEVTIRNRYKELVRNLTIEVEPQ